MISKLELPRQVLKIQELPELLKTCKDLREDVFFVGSRFQNIFQKYPLNVLLQG